MVTGRWAARGARCGPASGRLKSPTATTMCTRSSPRPWRPRCCNSGTPSGAARNETAQGHPVVGACASAQERRKARGRPAGAGHRRVQRGRGRCPQLHQAARRRDRGMGGEEKRLRLAQGHGEEKVTPDVQASASPRELLVLDAKKSENRVLEHPVWEAALEGK